MKVRFLSPARQELQTAVRYYNLQRAGLGDDFRDEAWQTLQRIKDFPLAWHPLGEAIHRCQMKRFPYGIIYQVLEAEIIVIAVACLHQAPEYWRSRTKLA